jgi:tRNA threonylcarbamoyladenosine biosynthesis protein TsaB
MAFILLIETATETCSVALSSSGSLLAFRESSGGYNHSEKLTIYIEEVLSQAGIDSAQLDAVCVSQGPGSYTGLRIGVSAAKGICYALGIPLIAISTLDSMASNMTKSLKDHNLPVGKPFLLCPMLDARRMEVYTAIYNAEGERISEIEAKIIDENSFDDLTSENQLVVFGNGADKCIPFLSRPGIHFIKDIEASARFMSDLAYKRYQGKTFVDVAYFEPFYLKDFIATIPKNKIL